MVKNIDRQSGTWLPVAGQSASFAAPHSQQTGMVQCNNAKKEDNMVATKDTCCTIVPYFKVHDGHLVDFKKKCEEFIQATDSEPKCLYYGFSFNGDQVHCREGYADAEGVLAHLDNVGTLLQEALKISDLTRLELHGPEEELAKLREPLADLNPDYFVLEYGFRYS